MNSRHERGTVLLAVLVLTIALWSASAALSATVRQTAIELRLREEVLCARLAALASLRGICTDAAAGAEVAVSRVPGPDGHTRVSVRARCEGAERSISRTLPF